jgi:hypothetical protein
VVPRRTAAYLEVRPIVFFSLVYKNNHHPKCIPDNPAPPNSATEEDHTGRSTLDDAHTSKHVAPGRSTCSHAVCPIALEAWELGELCELKWWWALRWAGVGWEPGKEKGEAGIG